MRTKAAVLAGIFVLLWAGGGARAQVVPQIGEVPQGIVDLLNDRGLAYETDERSLLEGTLTAGELGDRELRAFENARPIDFGSYDFEASTRFSGDLASPRVRRLHPGLEVRAYHVVEESQVADVEPVPLVEDSFYTFTREGPAPDDPYEGWRLASTDDFEPLGIFSTFHLWDGGPVATAESEHFLALTHPDRVDAVRSFLPDAEEAYRIATGFWPREAAERYVIVVPSSTEELDDMFQATVDLTKFVAFAGATVFRQEGGWQPAGVRMFINPPNFSNYDAAGRVRIFAHEMIHAITRPLAGPFMPSWVEEGLANAGAEESSGLSEARRGPVPEGFPEEEDFFVGEVASISRVYRRSQVAVQAFLDERGMEDFARFYASLGAARTEPGTDDHHLRRATEEAGWSLDEWREAWRNRLS